MINAIRTALLNLPGTPVTSYLLPGEEFVPADYRVRQLDPALARLRSVLVGPDTADRAYRNFMLAKLLEIAHTTGFDSLLRSTDKRVTYPIGRYATSTRWIAYDGQVRFTSAASSRVYIVGTHQCDEFLGRASASWQITLYRNTSVVISGMEQEKIEALTYEDGLSPAITLPSSSASIRIGRLKTSNEDDDAAEVVSLGALGRPIRDLGAIAATLANSLELTEVLRRTPEGKEAAQQFTATGPLWAVIGPAVVGVGHAILARPAQ